MSISVFVCDGKCMSYITIYMCCYMTRGFPSYLFISVLLHTKVTCHIENVCLCCVSMLYRTGTVTQEH